MSNKIDLTIQLHKINVERIASDLAVQKAYMSKDDDIDQSKIHMTQFRLNMAMCDLKRARAEKEKVWFDWDTCIKNSTKILHPE